MGSRLPPPCQQQSLGVDQWGQTVSGYLLEGVALLLLLMSFSAFFHLLSHSSFLL